MKIQGPNPVRTPQTRRAGKSDSAGGGRFAVPEEDAAPARPMSNAQPLEALEGLLAAQEAASDDRPARKWAREHGETILRELDGIRVGLLSGRIPAETITRLLGTLDRRRERIADPMIREALDEIELRARVELAKLERSGWAGPA